MTNTDIAVMFQSIMVWGWVFPAMFTLILLLITDYWVNHTTWGKYSYEDWAEIAVYGMVYPFGLHALWKFWKVQLKHRGWW